MNPQMPRWKTLLAALVLPPLLAACGGAVATAPAALSVEAEQPAAVAIPEARAPSDPAVLRPPAPAATALPAATAAAAWADAEEAAGAPRPPGPERPAPPPHVDRAQVQPIKAGETDDNLNFEDYAAYLRSARGLGAPLDVSERYIITVLNEQQQPVLDARVRVFEGQTAVFEGRTYAGGRTILFPRALGVSQNSSELRVTLEKGNSVAEGVLRRGQGLEQSFVLRGAEALPQHPRLDVLFLLDATGSMGDEISRIQMTIADIAARIDRIAPRPELRLALVAYRDREDEYVTRVYADFTPDVASFREALLQVEADGGGDTPEDLNEGLRVALQELAWADDAVRLTFLVADAPPHMDYGQQWTYLDGAREAVAQGIKIYPIAASNTDAQAEYVFRQLAQQTLARFIFLTYQPGQNGGAPGETTTMHVDPDEFTVERLDDLVVRVVERELAEAHGAR